MNTLGRVLAMSWRRALRAGDKRDLRNKYRRILCSRGIWRRQCNNSANVWQGFQQGAEGMEWLETVEKYVLDVLYVWKLDSRRENGFQRLVQCAHTLLRVFVSGVCRLCKTLVNKQAATMTCVTNTRSKLASIRRQLQLN